MSIYYPQAGASLRIVWEDFGSKASLLGTNKVYTINVQPKRFNVDINTYTQADTFELELDYRCFPFDPRCIKSAAVSIHVENMESVYKDKELNLIKLKDPTTNPDDHNALLIGFADEEGVAFNDSARTVTFKGRDYTAIFIDARWPGKLIDKTSGRVDDVIKSIIKQLPAAGDITLDNRTGVFSLPIISKNVLDFGKLAGKSNADHKYDNYWSVIQRVAAEAALICYMEFDKLVLTKPRTLYDKSKAVQLFYGQNIKTLEFNRKIGKQKGFNVQVASYSIEKKQKIVAKIPLDSNNLDNGGKEVLTQKVTTKGGVSETKEEPAPYLSFFVADVPDKDTLIERGEKIYEELARQELEGSLTTMEMLAPTERKAKFDMTKLRNGTPLRVELAPEDLEFINKTSNKFLRVKRLIKQGFKTDVANALADTLSNFDTLFYTRSASFDFSIEKGLDIKVDFVNFIETAGLGVF